MAAGGLLIVSAFGAGCRTTEAQRDVMVVRHAGPADTGPGAATTLPAASRVDEGSAAATPVGPITVRVDDGSGASMVAPGVDGLAEFVGQRCVVHLRRDAAGVAGPQPMPMSDTDRFGRAASVHGVLRRASGAGVLIEIDHGVRWVPAEVILAIDFPEARAATRPAAPR